MLQIDDANRHASGGIVWEILEAETAIEVPDIVIERVRQYAKAADFPGHPDRCGQRVEHQRAGVAEPVMSMINGQLPQQDCRNRVGLVALRGLGQERAFNLGGGQADIPDDVSGIGIANDAGA